MRAVGARKRGDAATGTAAVACALLLLRYVAQPPLRSTYVPLWSFVVVWMLIE